MKVKSNSLKGKTFEEIYGIEKAKIFKRKMSERKKGMKNPMKRIEVSKKVSIALKGKKFSKERKEKHKQFFNNPETRKKMSIARKGKTPWNKGMCMTSKGYVNPFLGKHHSKEAKLNISKKKKGVKMWAGKIHPRINKPPWNKGVKQWEGKIHPRLGKKHSMVTRRKLSIATSNYLQNINYNRHFYKGGYYKKIWMRSSWEIIYAKYLDIIGKQWEYEMQIFQLTPIKRYKPDFFLINENKFVEVKGFMTKKDLEKFSLFRAKFPEYKFEVISLKEIQNIKKEMMQYAK